MSTVKPREASPSLDVDTLDGGRFGLGGQNPEAFMMIVFYRELAAGQPKAEAMRRAQLAVKNDPRYAHPFYWAPFVLVGDWR